MADASAQVYVVEVLCLSILPIHFFQGNPFIPYFFILRTFPFRDSKELDYFKK